MELEDIVSKYPPKQIMLVPIAIIILALISLGATYLATGSPVKLGIEFTGGTLVTVPSMDSEEKVAAEFASYPMANRSMPIWSSWPIKTSIVRRSGT
jgi:preprotein translocase subunit SecF